MENREIIIELLEDYGIQYWLSGKNVSEGSINVRCPLCDDHSNHCGIFIESLLFSCWRCRDKGHLSYLMSVLTEDSRSYFERKIKAKQTRGERGQTALDVIKGLVYPEEDTYEEEDQEDQEITLPAGSKPITTNTSNEFLNAFLRKRKISIKTCVEYEAHLCFSGEYAYRMVVPIYLQDKMLAFQGMDLTGKSPQKTKTSSTSINDTLYLFDDLIPRTPLLLTEGLLDSWRMGKGSTCTFGTHITKEQERQIRTLQPSELIFLWDGDAYWLAKKMARSFRIFVDRIKVVRFPEDDDPDSFGFANTRKLIERTEYLKG